MTALRLVPITRKEAREFVARHHRHSQPHVVERFQVGLSNDDGLVGVAVAGLPSARLLCDGETIEITRLCTTGERNAASMLYGAHCSAPPRHSATDGLSHTPCKARAVPASRQADGSWMRCWTYPKRGTGLIVRGKTARRRCSVKNRISRPPLALDGGLIWNDQQAQPGPWEARHICREGGDAWEFWRGGENIFDVEYASAPTPA